MTREEIIADIEAVRKGLEECEGKGFKSAAPDVKALRTVITVMDKMMMDMEQLVGMYARLLESSGQLNFFTRRAVSTFHKGGKKRMYMPQDIADELSEAVRKYTTRDGINLQAEQNTLATTQNQTETNERTKDQ